MKNKQGTIILWIVFFVVAVLIFQQSWDQKVDSSKLPFSDVVAMSRLEGDSPNKIVSILFQGNKITGKLRSGRSFNSTGPAEAIIIKDLIDNAVKVTIEDDEGQPIYAQILVNTIPILILVAVFFFFMRQIQSGGGRAMSFGKSKAKMLNENQKKVTFEQVAGCDEAKEELEEIIHFLRDPQKFTKLGGRIPKGVLLMGPPGTGKTLIARAVAGEAEVPFFSISGSDFVEMFVGVGASRVRDLFEQAKKNAPCIIFIDEIDAVGRHRGAGMGGGHDEREQTLNQLLVEMDGFESNEGVILIAATNRPDVLDPALLRPGRFDRQVVVAAPEVGGRKKILEVHTKKIPLANNVNLETIAKGTPGFTGADLENLVNEAALLAARKDQTEVRNIHLDMAKDKVLMGPERRSAIISEVEKRNTAFHESGHTVVAELLPGADPVHKVTVIPRGRALGVTIMLPNEDRLSQTKQYLLDMICGLMGGRAAELIEFNEQSTGASNDIERATSIARKMVCNFGMSDRVGPISIGKNDEQPFLGREMATSTGISDSHAELVDTEIRRIVEEQADRAKKLLRDNYQTLKDMSEALIIKEVLNHKDIARIMAGKELEETDPEESDDDVVKKNTSSSPAKASQDTSPIVEAKASSFKANKPAATEEG